jgi:hypothetical protein
MNFNNFILSLQLDPTVFNPFKSNDPDVVTPLGNDDVSEGDYYELAVSDDDDNSTKSTYDQAKEGVNTLSRTVPTETKSTVLDIFTDRNSCNTCLNCQLSDDISDGSSCRMCSITGEYISDPDVTAAHCRDYYLKSSEYTDEIEDEI